MKTMKRLVSIIMAASMLLVTPSLYSCGKKGISTDQASEMMGELVDSGAIDLEAIEEDQAARKAEAEAAEAEKLAQQEADKQARIKAKEEEAAQKEAERLAREAANTFNKYPVEEVELENKEELYSAPAFTAEVYDPSDTREFKVLGAAYSDEDYAAIYGECKVGALVTATTENGEYSVQSEGGCFALRIYSPRFNPTITFTESYNGEVIDTHLWSGTITTSSYVEDESWSVWLGYGNQGFYNKMIPDYEHTNLIPESTVTKVKEKIAGRVENLKDVGDGCELIYLLVPSSMTTYPELVPDIYTQGEGESKFDQIANLLQEAGAVVIDLREAFTAHKNDSLPLYYNYDSHWTEYGAYIAYVELFDYISDRYPDAAPRKFNEFTWTWDYYTNGDMPWYFDLDQGGLIYEHTFVRNFAIDVVPQISAITRYTKADSVSYQSYSEELTGRTTINTNRSELPDIYMMRNSYGAALLDICAERCNESVFNTMFTYAFNLASIKSADPDYLIYCLSEWDFDNILDN